MIRIIRICFLWIGLFHLTPTQSDGQVKNSRQLKDIIDSLEHRFNVSFSYADKDLDTVKFDLPAKTLNLKESLDYLSKQTNLEFIFLSESYVAIRKKDYQILCGYVRDHEENEPLINATILIGGEILLSNDDGFFEIKISNETQFKEVIIRYVGYQPLSISSNEFNNQECPTFGLKAQTSILKEVTVTNYPVPGINKLAEGSFEINARELNILPGIIQPDILLTIQSLPGVQSIDESVSQINIRGGSTDQTLLLWNGIRMYQYGHFFGLISVPNPFLTKKVTLIKNGTSATIGDGVSGTVDIQTIDSSEDFEGEFGLNMLDSDFIIKRPIASHSNLIFSARRSINDLFTTPTYDQYFDRAFRNTQVIQNSSIDSLIESNQSFQFYDWSLTFNSNFNKKNSIEFNVLNSSNKIEYRENEIVNGTVTSRTSGLANDSFLIGFQYDHYVNSNIKVTSNSSLSSYKLMSINADILNDQRLKQENEVLDITTDIKLFNSISSRVEMINGYQFSEKGISNLEDITNPQFRRFKKEVLRTHSIFSESTYLSPSYNTNFRIGFRANYFDELEKFTFEPRLNLNQKLTNDLSLELLAETKSQSSTQIVDLQNDFLSVLKRQWRLSNNEDIPLIISRQLSTGIFYSNNILLSIEAYYKVVKGITSQSQEFQNQFEFAKTSGSYRVKGIEFLAKKDIESFTTWLSYHFSQNSYRFEDLFANDFPSNYEINHFINAGASYTKNKLELSSGIAWFSGRPFTQPLSRTVAENENISYETPNSSSLPNYFRFDLSSKYNFKFGKDIKGQIGLSIWNLFGQKNILNAFYRVNENSIERFNQLGLGITPNLSMRVWF